MKHELLNLANSLLRPLGFAVMRLPRSHRHPVSETMEEHFIGWLAERKGLSPETARANYRTAARHFDGGFGGEGFRRFLADLQDTAGIYYRPDSEADLVAAYQAHGLMHLLRMITYPIPSFNDDAHLADTIRSQRQMTVLDYGSGVGRYGISLGLTLQARGIEPGLFFLDVETIRFDFIGYVCRQHGLTCQFIKVTPDEGLYPTLPPHDICVATEVFEHMHRPLVALTNIHQSLVPGGLLYTNVTDQRNASMHVSLDMSPIRSHLRQWGYRELQPFRLYRRPT